jgi:hypothetical protein
MCPAGGIRFLARLVSAWRWAVVGALSLALGACGGGVFLSIGDFDGFDPSVSLTSAADTVRAGQTVRFAAAAADESGIDHVAFYRIEPQGGTVLLGTDTREPYEWVAIAPDDGRAVLQVFARARDGSGREADSVVVSVTILP